jgi:hypothetical protein
MDASSYALSALVLTALRLRMREPAAKAGSGGEDAPSWPLLLATGLAGLVVLRGLDALGSSSQHVGLPILGSQLRPDSPTLVSGLVWGCWAAGLLLASFVLRPLATKIINRSPAVVYCLATMVMSLGFIGVFWVHGWVPRLASAAIAGLGDALSEITFKQAMQRLPDNRRGRAFGFSQIAVNGGFMTGLLLTSLIMRPGFLPQWVLLLHGVPFLVAGWMALTISRVRATRTPAPVG